MSNARKVFLSAGVLGALGWLASGALNFKRDSDEPPVEPIAVNLTPELARLIEFSGKVAAAIGVCSAYALRSDNGDRPRQREDLMWLSDALHRLQALGAYIGHGSADQIVHACDGLITTYQGYRAKDAKSQKARECFERHAQRFSIDDGLAIFADIRMKVLPLVTPVAAPDATQAQAL
ncbi:hypothetical protein KTQ42_23190 [Noviherbaspirillum sp. L7-7A]|uniref:hypothetical protein n=1 Tax=Noviherbaspirillum sp. L7-7A TaxID=2850560 RepID=UPI001C2C3E9F|nr:hypothetical protein [Noviherbaspirillum sp. L7-7A]MBV0882184.1 hypothetical protein [Noviherbaspirillum sp. L7-7A]